MRVGNQDHTEYSGIGPGFVAENFERARDRVDEILLVEDEGI